MRVRIELLLVSVLLALSLVACGGGSSSNGGSSTSSLASISVNPGSISMSAGSTQQFRAMGNYSDGTTKDITGTVTWSSSSTNVATISSSGLAKPGSGVTAGSSLQTTISATSGSVSGSTILTVTDNLVSLSITSGAASVNVGANLQLSAMGNYQDGKQVSVAGVTWSSSASTVASVSNTGLVTGVKGGSATITATSGSIRQTTTITVVALVNSIAVSGGSSAVIGSSLQFAATANFNDGTSQSITSGATWSSSAPSVATVGATTGLVTAVASGSATIQAAFGGTTGSAVLTVTDNLVSIAITPSSPSVNVGSTLQLTATGTYQDKSTRDLTGTVLWSSNANSVAKFNSGTPGELNGVAGGSATITATDGPVSMQVTVAVKAVLQSMSVSPMGPAVQVNGKQQFTAMGSFNDGTVSDVTSIATWSSSDTTKASMSTGGLATGVTQGPVTVTAKVTAVNGNLITAQTALNVVPSGPLPNLNGEYTFTLTSADNRGPQFFLGSFTADGAGHITAGEEDANTGVAGIQNDTLTGSYFIYPDGRGNIAFNPNSIFPQGLTLRFILATSGNQGRMIQFDGLGTAKGSFGLQVPGALLQNATYVFRMSGIDSSDNPLGSIGEFVADGAGSISSGTADIDDYSVVTLSGAINPSAYSASVDAHGRGTLQLNVQLASGPVVTNYAYYVVSNSKILLMETDAAPSGALAGVAEVQANGTYNTSTLNGQYAFLIDRPAGIGNCPSCDRTEFAQEGSYKFDGIGGITGERDDTNPPSGITNPVTVSGGGYGISAAGRGFITTQASDSNRSYIFYLVSPTKAYVLQTYTSPTHGSLNAPTGEMNLQTTSFSKGTLIGNFALDASQLTSTYTEALVWLNFDGSGNIDGISDVSIDGAVSSSVVSNAKYQSTPSSAGRADIQLTTPAGADDYILYLISPQSAWVLGVNPPLDGSLNQQ